MRRVVVRQQNVERHIDKVRITEIDLAIGRGELQGLDHCVDVAGRIVACATQVHAAQDVQRFQDHRPLRPWSAAINIEAAKPDPARRFDRTAEAGEIILGDPAAILRLMAQDRAGDVAAIERVARRLQAGKAIAIRVRPLLIRHVLQCAAQIALHEDLAHLGRASARQEDRRRAGPLRKIVLPRVELLRQERIGREPIACEADRRRGHLAE